MSIYRFKKNLQPKSFLLPDNNLATSTSRQILHWSGDDPDGRVVGFMNTVDSKTPEIAAWKVGATDRFWKFITSNKNTFVFFGMPIHRLAGNRNVGRMRRRVFTNVFGGI